MGQEQWADRSAATQVHGFPSVRLLAAFLVMFERPRPMVGEPSNLLARTSYVEGIVLHALADGPHFCWAFLAPRRAFERAQLLQKSTILKSALRLTPPLPSPLRKYLWAPLYGLKASYNRTLHRSRNSWTVDSACVV